MSEIDIDALPEIKDGESTDIGALPEIDIDALPEIKDEEHEAEERTALPAEFPDVSPGIVNYKAIGENAAQAARERAAEEPEIVRATERRRRMDAGTQSSAYGTAPSMEWYDANVVNGITDTHGNTAKVGSVVSVEDDDGVQVRTDGGGKRYASFRFVGDDEKGTPLFKRLTEEEAEKETPKATMAKRVFRRMRGEGRIKMDSTPMEQVRLGILAETGREDLFGEGAAGQMRAAAHRAVPYIGRYLRDKYVGQIRSLSELRDGKIDGDWRRYLSDDIRTGKLDRAKFGARRSDETEEQFRERLRVAADEELKKRVGAMQEAAEEIGGTERDVTDMIVGGFIESSGYAGEFLIPGGVYGKALNGAKLLKRSGWVADKMNRLLRAEAIAAPVIAAEAVSRYAENTTPGFEILDDGTLQLRYEADTPAQAALSAIGGAVYDTNVEMGLEPLAMGVLRLAKKPAGWALGKMTPRVIQDMGAKRFSAFMASDLGRDLQAAYRAYGNFTDMTQINSPLGELAEEYFQAMERPLRMEGKASEYRGFAEEWNRFCDEQHSLKTQFETFLGLVGQLAIGSATSVYGTVKNRNDNAEVWRDIRGRLKRSGISDENISLLTDRQREVLTDIWRRYSDNPEKMREMVKGLGYAMRTATEELAGRNNLKFAETLEKTGLEPAKFKVAYAENGDLEFRHIQRFETDDKAVAMDAMVDAEHGVTVCDNKDGTYTVMNDLRGTTAKICPKFTQAYALATQEARRNQLAEENNRKKAEYFAEYIAPNYSGRDFHLVDSVETLRREMLQAIRGGGSYFGITDASSVFGNDAEMHSKTAGGFHAPDGTTVIVLDNIVSPNDMERVAAHEATGHEGVKRQADDVVAFATEIESESFDKFQDAVYRSRALYYMATGYGEEEAQQKAWEDVMSERGKQEVMANYAQDRLHEPTPRQRKRNAANEERRAKGENVPMDDADLEVALARAEAEGRSGTGKVTRGQGVGFRDIETQAEEAEEAPKEETGNAPESAGDGTPASDARDEEKTVSDAPQATQGVTDVTKDAGPKDMPTVSAGERSKANIYRKFKIGYADVDKLVVNKRIEQFKEGANPVNGVVSGQRLEGPYREEAENPILVYVWKDGTQEIGSGRHRLDLALRNGMKKILARFVYEEDGYTPEDIMVMDATSNIIDEKGTVKDYVKYFDRTNPTREEASAEGLIAREKGRNAFCIFEGATDDTRKMIDWGETGKDGTISPKDAAIIAEAAPKDADRRFGAVQRILVQKALAGLRGKKLGIIARSLAEEAKNRKDTPKVGGEMQLDLFTSEEDQALLAMEDKRAEYRVGKANEYGRIAEVLRTAVSKGGKLDLNAEYAQELGITDAKDKEQLVAARDKAVERANHWENAVTLDAADKAAMDAEITEKSEKAAVKREEIKAKAEAKIAEVKAKRTGKKAEKKEDKPVEKPIADKVTGVVPSKTDAEPSKADAEQSKTDAEQSKTDEPKERGVSKPSPKTKMRSAEEDAKAEKAEDDLAALFDSPKFDPFAHRKEESKWRIFDVRKPDGSKGSVHAYTMRQAQTAAEKKYGRASTAYEQGGLENAILEANAERNRQRAYAVRAGYPDGTGALGDRLLGAIAAGVLDGRTGASAGRALGQAHEGGACRSVQAAVGNRKNAVVSGGWRYLEDGDVVIPLSGRDEAGAINKNLRDVIAYADAFGDIRDIEFLTAPDGGVSAIVKGTPIVREVYPSKGAIAEFMKSKGFAFVAKNERSGGNVWSRKNITANDSRLSFGETKDGELVAIRGVAGAVNTHLTIGVDFDSSDFDPEVFQKRVGALAKVAKVYVDNGVGTFETLAERLKTRYDDKFGEMKPYLRGIWNAVAEQMELPEVTKERAAEIFDTLTNAKETDNGNARTTGEQDGAVLDAAPAADVAGTAEGEAPRGPSDRDRGGGPQPGIRDGGGRDAEGVPVVGPDVGGAAGGVPAGDGARGQGDAQEGGDAPQDAAAVAGGRGAGAEGLRVPLDAGTSGRVRSDGSSSGSVAEAAHKASPEKTSNYAITAEDEHWLNTSSPGDKVANNLAVIKMLAELSETDRKPTEEERTMLARYVGFGGFPQVVDQKYKDAYKTYGDVPSGELPPQTQAALKKLRFGLKGFDTYRELRQYLTQEEFDAIRQAMINAFYTPIDVCRSMHNALKAAGFNGGRMLEPSAGTGNMVGTGIYDSAPHWTAVELDKTTGKILEYLYPESNVKIQGFQEVVIPHNFIDAAITNVPFSNDIHPYDPEYNKYDFNLHDYFFAKTVDALRPGGVAALISSTGTLDKTDKTLLRFMEEHGGQIVGAVRLPNGHQSKNSGTEVAADIIFIQKVAGRADNSAFTKNGEMFGIKINDYFVRHPEMIFGTPEAGTSMYGNAPAIKFKATREPSELDATILKAAEGLKYLAPNETQANEPLNVDADRTGLRRGNIGIVDGKAVKREGDVIVPLDIERMTKATVGANGVRHRPLWPEGMTKKGATLENAIRDMVRLRDAYRAYVDAQKHADEETVMLKRASLNGVYDAMIAKYKHFNEGAIAKVFDLDDADGIILQGLEAFDLVPNGVTKTGKQKFKKANFRKADALKKRTLFGGTKADKADNTLDGLRISLNESGTVNLGRIAELTGKTKESVSSELVESGHVFQNPSTGGLETRDEYLSGSVRRKLREARAAAEVDPSFKKNVEELEKVQPEDKPATKIKYQLGQNFIPNEMYVEFLSERVFGTPEAPGKATVGYDEKKDTWVVAGSGSNMFFNRKCPDGTDLEDILVRIFNGSSLTVNDRIDDGDGKYHYVPNAQKTQAVEALRDDITAELSKWMVSTPERAKRIERAYNDKMNDNVERQFDTSLLTLDGISDEWATRVNTPGYEHQKRAITRGVFGGNLYIQHCVGAGKSFEMFSICMQLRRLGLARKPMLTVPNHMVESGQVLREFKEAYPGANILVATTKDLNSTNRRRFLAKAANGDWDCIVVPHSSFSLIGMDPKVQAAYIQQEIDDLREIVEAQVASGKKNRKNAEKRIEAKIASKNERIKKLLDDSKKDSTVPFENIGADYLFVDEAHNFKGLDITTKMQNVSGVTGSVSRRAQDLEMKCRYLAQLHGGDRGVIFASGTPISNSISESYTNARFMTPTRMREMGIYRFDDWAKNFGVVETKAAPRASGKGYQNKTRFARFQNLVELKRVNFAYADIVLDGDLNIPRPFMAGTGEDGKSVLGKPIVHKIPATDFQKQYVESLDKRLDSFKGGKISPKVDNALKVVTEGRLLAVDPGLLGLHDEHRRLETIADNVYRIWQKSVGIVGKDGKTVLDGTQLVFCDSGVPKPKKFSKVVRTKDGGFATKSGNYWQFYVSDVDANGMRHAKAVRSDGATFIPAPFADHARNGLEDISGVYAAFDEMAQTAKEYNEAHKMESRKHAKSPEGEAFDINAWLDENSEIVGYDVRFENPYAAERMADVIDHEAEYDEEDEVAEEEDEYEDEESEGDDGEDEDAPEKDQDEANNGDVAVENMLRGKFNIYSYLKKALVRRGVPAEDIVFIHDAEDAKAKRALFEKFNADGTAFRGGPRILIGNTPKMGEGANVQRRLVAIHHADIPWKPAWLTQRDGRGIRAGNLNESIGIHRYVTENTFDVYSYDKVSGKQQFINQVQSHDMSQDEIEDVDDAVLAAEEAKAAAAGPIGKYMMAKTRLEQGIRKAELTLANQQSDIFNAQSGIQWDEKRLQYAIKKMEADKAMLDKFAEAKGDKPFGIEVIDEADPNFGKVLTDNDELQKFLMKKVNEFVRKGAEDGLLGRLYGMPVWWKETRASDAVSQFGRIEVGAINAASAPIPIINRVAPIAKSTVSQFKSAVTHATSDKMLDEDRAAIAAADRRFEASKESLAKLKVDETLPGQIEDMKVELATTLNILGAKDAGIQSEAERILNQRILEGRDAEAAAVAYAELTKPQPVDRQLSDLEKESAIAEFDSPEFGLEDSETADEKTFGFTNEEVELGMKAANLPVPKHVTKHDEQVMRQADVLLSNREYMRKLAHAVLTRNGRPASDYENVALGIYAEQSKDALNAAKGAYDEMSKMLEELPADTDAETVDALKKSVRELRTQLAGARRDFREASAAKMKGASEQGRALRTNRFLIDAADYSYAGIRGQIEAELGKAEMPEKMDEEIGRLAENFKDLDERARKIAVERLKEFSKKVLDDMRRGGREAAVSGAKNAGNELKRVMRNYEDAMTQVQVHADEAGGTLIGLADQLYPSWGKWLRAIGEYHCYLNPDITEQGVIDAIREDLGRYLEDGIDETTVRDILTGFGHNYRQSRYDAQRKMNDLKAQALAKRQRDYMVETGKLPPQTGMVRDEPSDETRALRKEVQEIKKDIDEQEGGPRALKGALDSAKTRIRNQIADLENAIATGERIERSKRTLMEDAELKALKARRDELRKEYEAAFGERSTLTDEQRAKRAEKSLQKALERALERLGRAYGGDFSKAPTNKIDSPSIQALRDEIANTNKTIRDLKDAAFPMGTPEEIAKKNALRMEAREKAIQRLQERIISGDIRPTAKKAPPMPPDVQKQYDELGRQMKEAHRKLQQLREEARHATWFAIPREALEMHNYIVGSIMTNAASYDRSAVLRQALRLTAAKPVDAAKAYAKAEKAAWNEEYFNEVNGMVLADPIIREGMEKHGLRLHSTDIAHVHTLEMFRTPNTVAPRLVTRIGQMIGDIPIIGKVASKIYGAHTYIKEGSERHYVTYLNLMAGQTYKLLVDAMPGGASEFQKRKIAGLINILSGSGSMPERLRDGIAVANTINNTISPIIWSPSLWVSQIQHKAMADVWGAYIGKKDDVKEGRKAFYEATMVAKEAMKLRIRATLAIAALGAMISYACGNDEWWDELVANAKKLNLDGMMRVWEMIHHPVIGKTHIDLEMGERAFSRTIGSLVSGKVETSTLRTKKFGTYGGGDWYGLFGRYIGGKISPAYGALISFLQGRDYVGNPYGTKDLATSWIPLSMSDVFQSAIEDDWLDGTAPVAVTMTMLGAGGSVYDDKWYERTVNPFLENAKDIRDRQKDPLLSEDERKSMIDDIKNAAGGIFADDAKWQKAEAIAKSVRSNEMKLKKATSDLELAIKTGKNVNTEEALRMINEKSNEVNGLKRDLMDMILQQDNGNSFRPWRRR